MVERYYRELVRFLSRLVNDGDTAADIAQESYVRVLSLRNTGAAISDPRGLLYRTARNLVIDTHRRATVRAHHVDELETIDEPVAPVSSQPEAAWEASRRTTALVAAIDALPPRCREAFVLHKFDGLSHAEVAARMGISRNMVEKHVIRGVVACRQRLAAFECATAESASAETCARPRAEARAE
ncbi:sigma-70 family RNA polymerase sigma factor [Paraburkholderia acidisoli]|uniref:Sigma-70 family RNA polymerase sigma factor n=1 Tax=Paraburkholderia acidisoli TaxID=2571748 RepID=A0A7Z2GNU0_9BURK|nr:sigma-70 family RNA polymerase sigma factor [Paraburkholderia acidisoli]QGZ65158.1 sigma-70 family RNA polymerase sigma factor [Paraburkholderia acidisoli]